jgi:hypothetical protein
VQATQACVLFGKSGLGKTSLLLAGLFPLLRARGLLPVHLRAEHHAHAAALSLQLLRALDEAVAQAQLRWNKDGPLDAPGTDYVAVLWERLHDKRGQLLDAGGRRWTPVFVLDQFEEIFTLQPDERRRRQCFQELGDLIENRMPPAVSQRLDQHDELVDHIDQDSQGYRFLLSLREDFLAELEAWADLIPRLGPNRYRLLPMSPQQAFDAVRKTGGTLVDDASAKRVVEFLGSQTSQEEGARVVREARRIEPALLSLVCSSLNADRLAQHPPRERLDVTDLELRGAQILDRFYDKAFADLPEGQRARLARWVESDLITAGGTRRPYPLAAVDKDLQSSVRHLVDKRLLRIENTEQGDQVELVHDRLASIASQRARVTQQQAEAAERMRRDKEAAELELAKQSARSAQLAEEQAALELQRTREKLSAARKVRWLAGALAVVAVTAVAVAVYANSQRGRAEAEQRAASAARLEAETKATAAQQALQAAQSALDAASKASEAARLLRSTQPNRVSEATALLSDATKSYQNATTNVQQVQACPAGRRIYPHVTDSADGARVAELTGALRVAGFVVPAFQVMPAEKMPPGNEVRYFRREEQGGALEATKALQQAGLTVRVTYIGGYENSTAIRPCHYELWLAPANKRAG